MSRSEHEPLPTSLELREGVTTREYSASIGALEDYIAANTESIQDVKGLRLATSSVGRALSTVALGLGDKEPIEGVDPSGNTFVTDHVLTYRPPLVGEEMLIHVLGGRLLIEHKFVNSYGKQQSTRIRMSSFWGPSEESLAIGHSGIVTPVGDGMARRFAEELQDDIRVLLPVLPR